MKRHALTLLLASLAASIVAVLAHDTAVVATNCLVPSVVYVITGFTFSFLEFGYLVFAIAVVIGGGMLLAAPALIAWIRFPRVLFVMILVSIIAAAPNMLHAAPERFACGL